MFVSQYLQKAKFLGDELAYARRSLSGAEFNAIIYKNLGSGYHSIVAALTIRPDTMSFRELYGQLSAHEILIHVNNGPSVPILLWLTLFTLHQLRDHQAIINLTSLDPIKDDSRTKDIKDLIRFVVTITTLLIDAGDAMNLQGRIQ